MPHNTLSMHPRYIIIIGALAAMPLFAQTKTQNAEVTWGPDLNDKTDGDFSQVIGQDKEALYQLMSRKRDMFVQRMDLNMHVQYQKQLELEYNKKDMALEGVRVVGDNIVVFSSLYDRKEDQNNLYMKVYEAKDFTPKGHMEKIARIPAERANNRGGFEVYVSPDDSKILVEVEGPRERKKDQKVKKEDFIAKVFDGEMNPLWEGKLSLPYLDNEFLRESVHVDNDGSIVMVGVKYMDRVEAREHKRDGNATYGYHFVVFKNADDEPMDFTIDVPTKFLQDMTVSLGTSGDIICAGLYSEKGVRGIKGPFYMTLDRSTKAVKIDVRYRDGAETVAAAVREAADQPRGDVLQHRHGKGAERHQEHQVQQGAGEFPGEAPAKHRQHQHVEQAKGGELAAFHDAQPLGRKPRQAAGDGQQRKPPVRPRRQEGQPVAPLPGQPGGDRQDQPAMVVGGRGLPHLQRGCDLGEEQQPPGQRSQPQHQQGRPPPPVRGERGRLPGGGSLDPAHHVHAGSRSRAVGGPT